MSFLQPMNFDSAFRPVNPEHSPRPPRPNGTANRSQLCRGNDAKCCRWAGQAARPVGDGAELVWDDSAFGCGCHKPCHHCGGWADQCGCQRDACAETHERDRGSCQNEYSRDSHHSMNDCAAPCEEEYASRRCRGQNDCDATCDNESNCRRRNQDHCDAACDQPRHKHDNCADECDNEYAGRRRRRICTEEQPTGMVYHVEQAMEHAFCAEQALQAGTLYPDLYKPMNCADAPATNCPSKQQEKAFQLWELRLYLNTHPCDKKALRLYRQLAKELGYPNYASTFDEDDCSEEKWNWVSNPWPWECNFQRDKN